MKLPNSQVKPCRYLRVVHLLRHRRRATPTLLPKAASEMNSKSLVLRMCRDRPPYTHADISGSESLSQEKQLGSLALRIHPLHPSSAKSGRPESVCPRQRSSCP